MNENTDTLLDWMERQFRFSVTAMLRAVSATHLVKVRPSLGQTIRPARGSVVASPEIASYDPNPDYFFHWLRDSAIVIDALRVLISEQTLGPEAEEYISDFVHFSLGLCRLDGHALLAHGAFREKIDPAFLLNVRSDEELERIVGERVLGEARYNADGTLDIIKWARPQNDGPALRTLALLRFCRLKTFHDPRIMAAASALIEYDLDYTLRHWREPCFDLWEEVSAYHYHTRVVQYAALADGAEWMDTTGDVARAHNYRLAAQELCKHLDAHFDRDEGVYLSCVADAEQSARIPLARRFDIAVPLGVIHAAREEGCHSVVDPKAFATLARIEQLFAKEYEINRVRGSDCAPAMGRYAGDVYYSGGAYYFSTLGAAEYYFRFAEAVGKGAVVAVSVDNLRLLADMLAEPPEALGATALPSQFRKRLFEALVNRGDMFMTMVRENTPATGELSEQFDQANGSQTSARNLAWSYAAFITAFCSRRAAERLRRSA